MTSDLEYDKVLQQFTWAILVLLYIAASDGSTKAHERKIVVDFFMRRNINIHFDASKVEDIVKLLGRPDKSSFHKLIRERNGESQLLQDIYDTANVIIRSNAKPHTEQERAITYLAKSWKGHIIVE